MPSSFQPAPAPAHLSPEYLLPIPGIAGRVPISQRLALLFLSEAVYADRKSLFDAAEAGDIQGVPLVVKAQATALAEQILFGAGYTIDAADIDAAGNAEATGGRRMTHASALVFKVSGSEAKA